MDYTYNPNNEMNILDRVFNTAVFSNNSAFDITPFDLGEEQMSVEMEDEVVKRLPTAMQTVASVNIFLPITIKVPILKTSPAYVIWLNARMRNPILGECVLKDDVGHQCVIKQITLDFNIIDLVASTEFTIKGNFYVNQDLIKIPIKKTKT
ncbi:hypothetical protein HMPREF1423_01358 [Helicobacter pylori GAM270ASi]|uniref:hypothetical protein n=1 Tax=Helicobacter pylori TaxID=210 RepID=UPI0002BB95DD|nr:hypothetical protein [Helicobacter pylori]EMH28519.1 hypothetical protein HMPREF1423_01358 [Helicobacter pylori GAM270ASi]WQW81558.1 hypothetical protein KVM82_03490 [Helicobacter pylori]